MCCGSPVTWLAAAKTKDSALAERDRVHKAYKAVTAKILAENRERLPAAAAFADWLATDPSPDERHAAVMMMCNVLIAVDGMADPLPDEPPSTFHELRTATLTKHPKQIQNTTATKDNAAMLTINIASPEDAARLPALLASIMAQFGAPVSQPVAVNDVSRFGHARSPAPDIAGYLSARAAAESAVKHHPDDIAGCLSARAAEAPKRTRKPKVDAAPVYEHPPALKALIAAELVQPEPATDEPPPVEEADVVEPPAIVEEPAAVEVAPPAKPLTENDVLSVLRAAAMRDKANVEKVKTILAGYGATNLKSLPAEHYAAVIAAVEVLA